MRIALVSLTLFASATLTGLALAQTPTVGLIVDEFCEDVAVLEAGGEFYAVKVQVAPTGPERNDWQVHALSKEGPNVRMHRDDFAGTAFQVLGGNFDRDEAGTDVVFVFTTFPGGGLHLDSGSFEFGYNWVGGARVQQVGDSPRDWPGSAGVILPDAAAAYTADLGDGPEQFPRRLRGWPEIAFAPVVELDRSANGHDEAWCGLGGEAAVPGRDDGLIVGYNVFRVSDAGEEAPTLAAAESFAAWIDFVPLDPATDPDAGLSRLSDPDGVPNTGDEVLVYHDAPTLPDGRPRLRGSAPPAGERSWYWFQPVLEGSVENFEDVFVAHHEPVRGDARADLDGDGVNDAVDYDGAEAANGPEFLSPQVQAGLAGIGLTNDGRPLLSKAVAVDPATTPTPNRARPNRDRRPRRR